MGRDYGITPERRLAKELAARAQSPDDVSGKAREWP